MTTSGGKKTKNSSSSGEGARQTAALRDSSEAASRPARAAPVSQAPKGSSAKSRGGTNKKSGGANKKSGGANKKSGGANETVASSEEEEEETKDDTPFWEGIVAAAYRSRRARGDWPKD